MKKDRNNKTLYKTAVQGQDGNKYEFHLEYNSNLGIWQIFKYFKDTELSSWVANQKYKQNLLSDNTSWIFSPEYHYENYIGKYDYFDYPNQFNKDKQISLRFLNYTRTATLKIVGSSTTKYKYDCNSHKGNIKSSSISEIRNKKDTPPACKSEKITKPRDNRRFFNSTLFNLPNISETNAKGELINFNPGALSVDH